ncbi:hypothetical protein [Streptococcus suis]|uniref:Uncharacterized protein n=2 Tax=Streptococcus suis TaxID=1307 RepID=A0A9X4RR35_STRSU|nr:hypothetical protein [Streptococcus suis]MBY5015598.1 hypothetical protein [Streptococcus suis]MDG4517381.1 hypothetical protein [Streptococcus suis]MDG4522102.1 hypothetical protein [Streptococcus suis]MDW8706742.1 hypothetical protein [Streptococcus suis]HEL1968421.1 hypothetical protein [Streptococcus suis]
MEGFVEIIKQNIKDIPDTNPYKRMMELGFESIQLFENEKNEDDKVKNVLSIRLLSDDLPSGQIGLRQLTETLSAFESVQENGMASILGFDGKRGKIPKDILARNELIITATRAGSFIIDLGVKDYQLSMFEAENQISTTVLNDMSDLLEGKIDTPEFVENYNSRTFNSVKQLISKLNKENLGVEILDNINDSNRIFAKESVKEINKKFKDTHVEKFDNVNVRGKLIKVDLSAQKITLENPDGLVSIKIKDPKIKNHHLTTNEEYEVKTNVKDIVRRTIRTRTYTAMSVNNITKL